MGTSRCDPGQVNKMRLTYSGKSKNELEHWNDGMLGLKRDVCLPKPIIPIFRHSTIPVWGFE
jgi:hypothetical protein